jgi:rubrerythrin
MRFQRTRDLLEHARRFHAELGGYYRQLEQQADQTRVRLLLDYLSGREAEISRALADFINETPERVLDAWFGYADGEEVLKCPSVEVGAGTTVEDIMRIATRLHECSVEVFETVARESDSEEVRAVFQSLAASAQKEWQKLARNVGQLMDF